MSTATVPDTALTGIDLEAYLARVGHPGGPPTLATLRSLTEAHIRAIPFENVDVILGDHPGIALDVVVDKLVRRRRGGYCYEHAGLFAAVLEALGFAVHRGVARVQPHRDGPYTHMMLLVRATDDPDEQLVDVGFGAGMLVPMPLRDGEVVDQAGWAHRLDVDSVGPAGAWTLSKRTADGWEPQHAFDHLAGRPIDYEVFHHYVSTHPHSPFTGQLVVMRLEPRISRRFVGREVVVEHADGRVEHHPVTDPVATLRTLDVDLDDAEAAALQRWWATTA